MAMTTTETTTNTNGGGGGDNASSKLSALDRSVVVVLQQQQQDVDHSTDTNTNNNNDGISPDIKRLHCLHGTSLIFESSKLLNLGASTFATACTIFHRFYHQVSLREHDVWSVAMASTLLATKVEEESHTLKAIIHVYCHLYRKRLLIVDEHHHHQQHHHHHHSNNNNNNNNNNLLSDHPAVASLSAARQWTLSEKDSYLQQLPLPMKLGPVYQEWHKQISDMEAIVLRQLGFTLYWIPDSHPHKFILYFCRVLELTDNVKFSQRAWNYCNDSCRLDLCIRYEPEVIASSSILLAANDMVDDDDDDDVTLPLSPCPWWEVFIGKDKTKEMMTAANVILGLVVKTEEAWVDSLVASRTFVKSLKKEPSFNDPESFLWDHQKDLVELKKPNA